MINIFIIADDPLVRSGLAQMLRGQDGLAVLGQGGQVEEARLLRSPRPAPGDEDMVVLWDLGADPQAAGGRLAAAMDVINEERLKAVVWLAPDGSIEARGAVLTRLIHVVAAGALAGASEQGLGVVRREASAGRMGQALQAAVAGLMVLDPGVLRTEPSSDALEALSRVGAENLAQSRTPAFPGGPVAAGAREDAKEAEGLEALTAREVEVLGLAAEGLANKAIAARLGISEHTVKFHINTILGKLGAASRTEAVTRAARLGWIVL